MEGLLDRYDSQSLFSQLLPVSSLVVILQNGVPVTGTHGVCHQAGVLENRLRPFVSNGGSGAPQKELPATKATF